MEKIGKLFVFLLIAVPVFIWEGFVLSVMWRWFFVPTLDIPPIGVAQAIGISFLISMFVWKPSKDDDDEEFGPRMIRMLLSSIIIPTLSLLAGYFVHLFL